MIGESRRKTRLVVGILLTIVSLVWLILPISRSQLAIPIQAAYLLLVLAVFYNFLTYLLFPKLSSSKASFFFNLTDFLLVTFAISVTGGMHSTFLFFYCPLIIQNALFHGPLIGFLAGLSSSILAFIASLIAAKQFSDTIIFANFLTFLILHPLLGWLIGEIGKREKEATFKKSDLPPFITSRLTSRETLIVRLLTEGKTNLEIASELGRSEKTIKNHLSHIYQKLGINSRYELILLLKQKTEKKS